MENNNHGFADLAGTAMLGWHTGRLHTSAGLTVFAPTAAYDLAEVWLKPALEVDHLLNFSRTAWLSCLSSA